MVLAVEGASSVHERLVAYVWAVCGGGAAPGGVWREHSYARPAQPAPAAPRALLAAPPPAPGAALCVDDAPPPRPALPGDAAASDDDDSDDDEWAERAAAHAPSAAHARLAERAAGLLRDLRLARLASAGPRALRSLRRDQLRAAAAKLRRLLAPAWSWGGAAWLAAALGARRPALLAALRRAAPRLARRLPAPPPAHPDPDPLEQVEEEAADSGSGPVLVWVSAGCARDDARWTRRLRALLPVRELSAPAPPRPPARWAAARLAALRHALAGLAHRTQGRPLVVCGAGAGAALAEALAGAGGAAVRGAVLLGAGGAGGAGGGGAVLRAAGGAGGGLRARGADERLRLPARLRTRLAVPQAALDAAIAEEVYRWVLRVADTDAADDSRDSDCEEVEEDFSHLPPPPPASPPPPAVSAHGNPRGIEIVEGRVVTRVSGGTPLLLAPRRPAAPAAPPAPAAPADIMSMPIVFADDDPAPAPAPAPPPAPDMTVRSGGGAGGGGALKYTRVIVAKRGAPAPRAAAAPRGARAPRPLLLRRMVGRPRHSDRS